MFLSLMSLYTDTHCDGPHPYTMPPTTSPAPYTNMIGPHTIVMPQSITVNTG